MTERLAVNKDSAPALNKAPALRPQAGVKRSVGTAAFEIDVVQRGLDAAH